MLTGAAVAVVAVAAVVLWLVIPGSPDNSTASPDTASAHPPAVASPAVAGETVKQVLLDGDALAKMLGQGFKASGSPIYGGFDEMVMPSTIGDCVGVVNLTPKSAYQTADVQSYARETWVDAAAGDEGFHPLSSKVMFVDEAVVALPSAADAQALFAKFAEQWKRCDGQAVNPEPGVADADRPRGLPGSEMHITDVRGSDTVLSASIVLDKNPGAPDTRAVGVQGNCLVGVLIAFTGVEDAAGSADPATSSSDVVRAMMGRVSTLS